MHDLVADAALVAQLDEPLALRVEQLDHQALVVGGAFLDAVGVPVEAGGEAVAAVVVEARYPLRRVLAHPVFLPSVHPGAAARHRPP